MRTTSHLRLAAVLVGLLGACSVDNLTFRDIDSGPGGDDVDATPTENVSFDIDTLELEISEGDNKTFKIKLHETPRGDIHIVLASKNTGVATVSPAFLDFTPANAGTLRTVTVTSVRDPNAADETTKISITYGSVESTVSVEVNDTDTLGISATPSQSVSVVENDDEGSVVNVQLTAQPQPSAPVTVKVATGNDAVATASPAELVFTSANWNVDQPVTVVGSNDENLDPNQTTLDLSAGDDVEAVHVGIDVVDDDVMNIAATGSLSLTEAAGNSHKGTIEVYLTKQPDQDFVVAVTSLDPLAATVNAATLTFTPQNYNVPQLVEVTAAADADTRNEELQVKLAHGATEASTTVSVVDDDQQLIVVDTTAATIPEGGTKAVKVHLAFEPDQNVVVSLTSDTPTAATVTPVDGLTFTPGDYNADKTFTIKAEQDVDVDDATASVAVTSPSLATKTVAVTVDDDDVQHFLTDLNNNTIALNEGTPSTFSVSLAYKPSSNVSVTVASTDTGAVTVAPSPLTFTPANYAVPQAVTITPVQDPDTLPESVTVNLTSTGITTLPVTAGVTDDDQQTLVVVGSSVTMNESATATFTVALQFQPAANVTVGLVSNGTGVATVSPSSLTFTSANFAMPQTVTVTGVDDVNVVPDSTTITVSSSGVTPKTVNVTVNDLDDQGIVINASSLTVTEGSTGQIKAHLLFQPAGTVTVAVASANDTIASVSPASLSFGPGNYATDQTVTVTGKQDVDTNNGSVDVTFSSSGLPSKVNHVTVNDDDVQTIIVTQSAISMTEGNTKTFGVHLSSQPAGNITVSIGTSDSGAATTDPTSLTFSPGNYEDDQTVTVTAEDDVDLAAENVTLTLGSVSFPNTTPVTVAIAEDDVQAIVVSTTEIDISETATANLQVNLAFKPAGNVIVNVVSGNGNIATTSTQTLTFTSANYATQQTVQITGFHDSNLALDSTTVTVSSGGLPNKVVSVDVADIDVQAIITNTSALSVNENSTGSFTVKLDKLPSANVTVTLTTTATTLGSISPTSLTFTPANFGTAQTVTVTPTADNNNVGGSFTATASVTGVPSKDVVVTINDTTTFAPFGFRTFFDTATAALGTTTALAYKVSFTGASATLDSLGIVQKSAGGTFRLAVYTDNGGVPGSLIVGTAFQSGVANENTIDVADTVLSAGTYWIALGVTAGSSLGKSSDTDTVIRCSKGLTSIAPWPTDWNGDPNGTCGPQPKLNVFGVLFRQ